jgi:hypothetical protein
MYDPCYTQNLGLVGFRCRVGACTKVVRTYRGIVMHCLRVHKLRAQMTLPGFTEGEKNENTDTAKDSDRNLQRVR